VLIVRLKQCERALADGRLDEAYDLARQSDFRGHRRGQELINELVPALVERGRRHLAQGRFVPASADADKAVYLGGNLPDAVQLRDAVSAAMRSGEKVRQQAAQAVALARRHADQGQLTVGEHLLDHSPAQDDRIDWLKQDLAARRAGLESALKKATAAFDAGDWETAIDQLNSAGRGAAQDASIRQLSVRIADHVADEACSHIESGRLDSAAALMARIDRLPAQSNAADQMRAALDNCRSAYAAISAGDQQSAEQSLRRLQTCWPKAAWINPLADQVRQLGQLVTTVHASPISLLTANGSAPRSQPNRAAAAVPQAVAPAASSGESMVLHIDGIGSFLILTGSKISIGPVSSSRTLDLPLTIDPSVPTINIARMDGDYFLSSDQPTPVNDVPVAKRMLADADRISLGSRCRVNFRRPSAASGTAVLDVSGSRLPAPGVRQAILLDREIIIGPGSAAHVRADTLSAPVVLRRTPTGLACRSATPITIDDRPAGNAADLPAGAAISIASLRFVISGEQRS